MSNEDRSWMYQRLLPNNTINPEFAVGVQQFLNSVGSNDEYLRCPCIRCGGATYHTRNNIKLHLYRHGFQHDYIVWNQHGEVRESMSTDMEVDAFTDRVSNSPVHPMVDMVFETVGDNDNTSEIPNADAQRFYKLLQQAEEFLWNGCEVTTLTVMLKLMNVLTTHGISEVASTELLKLISEILPRPNNLPTSHYKLKQRLKNLGMHQEKIDACPNDCILYYKENQNLTQCSICNHPRYKSKTSNNRYIAQKQLRYFPLIPRLKRMYQCSSISKHMTWYYHDRQDTPNELRHPADGEAWKHVDRVYPDFSSEVRNIRLGLSTDGFCPFGSSSTPYSCWPVIVTLYNLPPWWCNTPAFMFLTLLIPGPKSPNQKFDIYMRPLIDELKLLWNHGIETFDSYRKENFLLRAILLWTISDFPAYAMLSGWSTHGKLACPYCMNSIPSFYLPHYKKCCFFDCHRRFLPRNHRFRRQKWKFSGRIEKDVGIERITGYELENEHIPPACRMSDKGKTHNWTKRSIFFELPYWSSLLLRHNVDVMHVEKNVFDNIFYTIMNVKGKTKDTLNARKDLVELNIRKELHPISCGNNKFLIPKSIFTLMKDEIKRVCDWLRLVKFPDGFASNIGRCVRSDDGNLMGMKTHDCHVLMQRLIPILFIEFLPKPVNEAITEVSHFFRYICSSVVKENEMKILGQSIIETLCKLEKIFPPSFFDSMEHMLIHLPYEAQVGGPVQYRWMYPYER